ncbi:ABC transporter permease [Paraburkholderia sp. IW21]|uniref:ABC transporter permease n=1 Tax=Paraburkholderia sp. IW21 TaxID=3242488 RepID=UPI003521F95F
MHLDRRSAFALLIVPLLFVLAFFVAPFGTVVWESFRSSQGVSLDQYAKLFDGLFFADVLWFTFRVSFWVTGCAFLVGYPLAYLMTRVVERRWIRRVMYVVIVTPLFTSNIVRSFGWMILLGRRGLINDALVGLGILDRPMQLLNNELSIVIGMTYIMVPFMVLTVAAVLQNIDRALEHAARDLGANGWTTFLKVTFPLSMPGVAAGALIVFTLSVSAYVTPSILSGGKKTVMSMLIYQQYATLFDFHFGAALAVALLLATLLLIAASRLWTPRGGRRVRAPGGTR